MQREFQFPVPQDVLYIEDHPTNVHLMQALFKRRPHLNLLIAKSGAQAREQAQRLRPALLLVDLRLPDCDGDELLEELRALEGWADIPAIAVTAEAGFRLEGSGFLELWPKPLDLGHVLDRLDQLAAPAPLHAAAQSWQPALQPT